MHPVVWIGWMIDQIQKRIPRNGKLSQSILGIFIIIIPSSVFVILFVILSGFTRIEFGSITWIIILSFMFKPMFAIKSFRDHALPIIDSLEKNDLKASRYHVSKLLSRDVRTLDFPHIRSGTIESISENLVDSIIAPFFYFALLGLPGAIIYRIVNTADAMVGYKNQRYRYVGFFTAKLDDILNWIPARLSIPFLAISFAFLRLNWRASLTIAFRHGTRTESPNSGLPMACMAGGLSIALEKNNHYFLGEGRLPHKNEDIILSLKVSWFASLLFTAILTIPLFSTFGLNFQLLIEDLIYRKINWS
ncbi:MAG: Cobalamin biosynthesis protein CbiB [Candidatus Heimdallarchaeota archaeon LC_2]|nr:MAG: Cobalamin biosynthesis protein CbiB [Candidatus Heimdallarchaeota archaeon LC_2]